MRGELRLTHAVLDSDLSPLAKLVVAAVEYFGHPHIALARFEALLPATRAEIHAAIAEAEAYGFILVTRPKPPNRRRHANSYVLSADANPQRSSFTRLLLSVSPGRSAARWTLRAVFDREQARRGAVQLPDTIAARIAGTTPQAVRQARADWKRSGSMVERRRATKAAPGIFTLTDSPYPARLGTFDFERYRIARIALAADRFVVWGTGKQHSHLSAVSDALSLPEAARLAVALRAHPAPVPATIVFGEGEALLGDAFREPEALQPIPRRERSVCFTGATRLEGSGEWDPEAEAATERAFAESASWQHHPPSCDCAQCGRAIPA
jgi:hypothetical protein